VAESVADVPTAGDRGALGQYVDVRHVDRHMGVSIGDPQHGWFMFINGKKLSING
jgi:hypothetical protein